MNIELGYHLDLAVTVASRSPFTRFRTGCVLTSLDAHEVVGWSHPSELRLASYLSIHAEMHAMMRADPLHVRRYDAAFIATLTRKGNTTFAAPCVECASNLRDFGVRYVYFTVPQHRKDVDGCREWDMLDLYNMDGVVLKKYRTRSEGARS